MIEVKSNGKCKDITGRDWLDDTIEKLSRPQRRKVKRFLKLGCVTRQGGGFLVSPLPGNNVTYRVKVILDGFYECECQFSQTKHVACSHIGAVREWLARQEGQLNLI